MSRSVEMSANSSSEPGQTRLSGLKDILTGKLTLTVYPEEGENEEKNEVETFRWVINPRSHVRHYYLMFMVILTFVNLITIPLDMAFSDDMHGNAHTYWVTFNVFSDTMFCLDVGINFRMGIFSDDGQAILDPKLIRNDYFKSWFSPDVVAAFPVDIIIIIVEQFYHTDTDVLMASKLVRILMFARIFSMIRLLRVPKLLRFCFELESVSDIQLEEAKKFFRIFFMFMLIILIWHWNTCVQYFISLLEEFPDDCWVMQENIKNTTIGEKYSYSSFRAFSQLAWISTKSIQSPTRMAERWTAVVSMVVGYIMCFALIACLMATVGSMSATGNEYKKKISQLQSSKMFKKLPRSLRQRTTAQYKWQYDKKNILDLVSKRLRKDIMADMCPNLLSKGSMLIKHDREFTDAILVKLEYELFQAEDIILHQDAKAAHMFFIEHGRVLVKNQFFQMELCDGDHFGEISFLFGGRQLATVSALAACSLFALSIKHFEEIEEEFPHVVKELRAVAQQLKDDLEGVGLERQVTSASNSVCDDTSGHFVLVN
ncbi:potassium/sodium hyperpolarization-activated cyclic nucleotide-gated channel 1-like [Sinocyclocheilus grahami]|uniref:Potassium/sodium hyperpolarization-activated cyclic nucleotide-gated channel 1-like n=1 Tax=Sinocyclocheilus grahami TaxID=75366 RepID=A0A672RNN6_SINGR|nr:PREDICTED: potassium/sodium hyperpolarization-activated cyclic nucleotide-gated channel 1-like [Sinocyclocheilus grahami]